MFWSLMLCNEKFKLNLNLVCGFVWPTYLKRKASFTINKSSDPIRALSEAGLFHMRFLFSKGWRVECDVHSLYFYAVVTGHCELNNTVERASHGITISGFSVMSQYAKTAFTRCFGQVSFTRQGISLIVSYLFPNKLDFLLNRCGVRAHTTHR